jgi:putative transcriptional regulator
MEAAPMRASCRLQSAGALLALLLCASITTDAALAPDREPASDSLAGQLLVAAPELADPNFEGTVVYLVLHDRAGAMGLVINRLLGAGPLDRVLEGLGLAPERPSEVELRVHYGGPVEPARALVLHSPDWRGPDTLAVSDLAALTPSPGILEDIAAGRGPKQSLFALGYAGWAPGQLESELAAGAWHVVEADAALLFDEQTETKWQRAFDRRGVEL